jgi:hypothetical protein
MKKQSSDSPSEKLAGAKRKAESDAKVKEPAKKRVKKAEPEEEKKGAEIIATPPVEGAGAGMNAAIAEQVERLLKYYTSSGDKGRSFGYRNALRAIKSIEEPIHSADQLVGRPGLGEGIIKKIREFIADGTIKRFEFIDTDPKTKAI